jgi:hypothetical protein
MLATGYSGVDYRRRHIYWPVMFSFISFKSRFLDLGSLWDFSALNGGF